MKNKRLLFGCLAIYCFTCLAMYLRFPPDDCVKVFLGLAAIYGGSQTWTDIKKMKGEKMGIIDSIKEKALEIAETKINERVNLYPAGVEVDEKMDKSPLGEKISERIQEGLVTDSFFEFLAGLHHEDKDDWARRLEIEAHNVKGGKYGN